MGEPIRSREQRVAEEEVVVNAGADDGSRGADAQAEPAAASTGPDLYPPESKPDQPTPPLKRTVHADLCPLDKPKRAD